MLGREFTGTFQKAGNTSSVAIICGKSGDALVQSHTPHFQAMLETVAREMGSLLKSKADDLERNNVFYNAFLWRKQFTTTIGGLHYVIDSM
jgi:hypothetical protein